MMNIRPATRRDLDVMVEILNQAIEANANGITQPVAVEDRVDWFRRHNEGRYPLLVAAEGDTVMGWANLSEYRPGRAAFRHTAEVSYYVHQDHWRKGVGAALMKACIAECQKHSIRTLVAILLDDNEPSIGLLRKFGFSQWGLMPGTADIDGREVGHAYYGLRVG